MGSKAVVWKREGKHNGCGAERSCRRSHQDRIELNGLARAAGLKTIADFLALTTYTVASESV